MWVFGRVGASIVRMSTSVCGYGVHTSVCVRVCGVCTSVCEGMWPCVNATVPTC